MSKQVRGLAPLLQIFDMPTSLAFYVDVLGCRIVHASGPVPHCGWAHLALGDTELMLNTMYEDHDRPSEIDSDRAVAHGDTALNFLDVPTWRRFIATFLRRASIAGRPW